MLPALCGVYQGAKPYIYHDPRNNQKPRVHDYDEENDLHAIHYLDDFLLIRNYQDSLFGLVPGLPPPINSPLRPPSPASTDELESNHSDTSTVSEPGCSSLAARLEYDTNYTF